MNAPHLMGSKQGGAVFVTPLDTQGNLQGRWTQVSDLRGGPAALRILTERELIQTALGVLSVVPIEFKNESYCLKDDVDGREHCYMLAKHEDSFVIIEMDAQPGVAFELVETLYFQSPEGKKMPSSEEIAAARVATVARARAAVAAAEERKAAEAAREARRLEENAARAARRAANGFDTRGLRSPELFTNIYDGVYTRPESDDTLAALFMQYVESSATSTCIVPADRRVELQKRVCDSETVNMRTGEVLNPCSRFHFEPRGVYADAELHRVAEAMGMSMLKNSFSMLDDIPQGLPFTELLMQGLGRASARQRLLQSMANDVRSLFAANSCNSPGMKQFENNLRTWGRALRPPQ